MRSSRKHYAKLCTYKAWESVRNIWRISIQNVGYYLLMFKEENLSHWENITIQTNFGREILLSVYTLT